MDRKFGFSFSWKRATGISGAKNKISRKIGVPLTRSGRQKKVGRADPGRIVNGHAAWRTAEPCLE